MSSIESKYSDRKQYCFRQFTGASLDVRRLDVSHAQTGQKQTLQSLFTCLHFAICFHSNRLSTCRTVRVLRGSVQTVQPEIRMAKPAAKKAGKKGFKKKLNNDKLDAEFRKARLDVFKFGVKHLSQKDKEATKYDQLVRLGAQVSASTGRVCQSNSSQTPVKLTQFA